jgi:hypothetical protein
MAGNEYDPLDGILDLKPEQQIPVMVSVLRSTRAAQDRMEAKLGWINKALWSLVVAITVAAISLLLTRPATTAPVGSAIRFLVRHATG